MNLFINYRNVGKNILGIMSTVHIGPREFFKVIENPKEIKVLI